MEELAFSQIGEDTGQMYLRRKFCEIMVGESNVCDLPQAVGELGIILTAALEFMDKENQWGVTSRLEVQVPL